MTSLKPENDNKTNKLDASLTMEELAAGTEPS